MVTYGGHKTQKDGDNLPHPYAEELAFFDNELLNEHPNINKIPEAHEVKPLDQTPFTFVNDEKTLLSLCKKLQGS